MKDIIIFGAGRTAVKEYDWAVFAGYHVLFFVDNDSKKWGKTIKDIPIYSPEVLKEYKCTIVFSDLYGKEIEEQLREISYQGRRLGFKQLKKETVCDKDVNIDLSGVQFGKKTSFIFDAYFTGTNWGGVESWSCMVSNKLSDFGVRTSLICGLNERFDEFANYCIHFSDENEVMTVKKMAVKIAEFLPCIFISQGSIALHAAQIVKSLFPDQIQLIIVAHGDEHNTYETIHFWFERIDKIICISKKIQSEFQTRYHIKKDILVYRPNPICIPAFSGKRMSHKDVLKIGFAARLRKEQKRAHLLPEIIDVCIQKKLNVEFNIAGEGECLELLQLYISDKQLENRVHVLGWVAPTEMAEFWSGQDVYLNISDFEGMSLAMLEAMACGCVPVVTNVSGVNDVIEDGENGFVIPVDNWLGVADKIEILNRDREMLKRAGDYNIGLIREKYDVCDYAKWLVETFYF